MSNEAKLAQLHPVFANRVRQLIAADASEGIPIRIDQGLRTWAEQDALFAQGRTTPGQIVTKAPGGHSQHNFGLAVDFVPLDASTGKADWNASHPCWKRTLELAPQFKLAEGAQWRTFPDMPHLYPVELPSTCDEFRAYYEKGGIPAVWTWFESLIKG